MSFIGDLIGDVFGGITGSKQAGEAALEGANIQAGATDKGIAETQRQFDKLVELMMPYVTAGTGALSGQQALIGQQGAGPQQSAISAIQNSPEFLSLQQQGENSILQNASATGGLRGGNVQSSLAQFSPQLLAQLIQQQYSRLGGITQIGQASAAGQASAGMAQGENVANLLANRGAALAGGTVAAGGAPRQAFGDILGLGTAAMIGGWKPF